MSETRREKRRRAREKALRAARAVTLGAAMTLGGAASLAGCADAHEPTTDASMDAGSDSAMVMDSAMADAGCDPAIFPPATRACCDEAGGFWDDASGSCAVAVPGPFTPPSMSV